MAQRITSSGYVGTDAAPLDIEAATARHGRNGRRHLPSRSVLPTGRALLGGLLVAVAAVGTFAAWRQASGGPDTSYVVAQQSLQPGQRLSEDDLRRERLALPPSMADAAFNDPDDVIGRIALGPIGEDELLQAAQVSESPSDVDHSVEVSFTLPRDRAVDGRLRSGDRVDVFVTRDDHTTLVLERIQLIAIRDAGGSSLVAGTDVTVTVSLEDAPRRADLIQAVRAGDVTLVRSTHQPWDVTVVEDG